MIRLPCVLAVLAAAVGCDCSPCQYLRQLDLPPSATPFDSGETAFSPCEERCPLWDWPGSDFDGTPATVCYLYFYTDYPPLVVCGYGPDGHSTTSEGVVRDIPNEFSYCEQECPDEPYLTSCYIVATPDGVEPLRCSYGESCDD